MKVTIDIDGVLADCISSATHKTALMLGLPPTHPIGGSWALEQAWTGHGEDVVKAAGETIELLFQTDPSVYEYAKPIQGWIDLLKSIAQRGQLAGCVTRRNPKFHDVTENWLRTFTGIPNLNRHCEIGACKSSLLEGVDFHIEDSLKEVVSILESNSTIEIILVDAPYNQGFKHKRVNRVKSAAEAQLSLNVRSLFTALFASAEMEAAS